MCHEPGVVMMHVMPCCYPDKEEAVTPNQMPEGYTVLAFKEDGSQVLVGMDFRHMSKDCADTITYEGVTYQWGAIEAIPSDLSGVFCCLRAYTKIKQEEL
jgi:hypothetical protein